MQKAILMAQICLYLAVLLPGFSDMILGLRGIAVGGSGWALALIGPIGCVILCEACKLITKMQKQNYQAELALRQEAEATSGGKVVRKVSSHHPTKVKSSAKIAEPVIKQITAADQKPIKRKPSASAQLCGCLRFA